MSDQLTITGIVGTEPRCFTTTAGIPVTSFRLATSQRVFDRETQSWRDQGSNWYTVACFRGLAENTAQSVHKGEHLIVHGRLRIKSWSADGREGTNVDIEAEALGHDLVWGTAVFSRTERRADPGSESAAAPSAGAADGADGFVPDGDTADWPTAHTGTAA